MRQNRYLILSLIAVIVVTLALTVAQLITPPPQSFNIGDRQGTVSRTRLALAGGCFDFTWENAGDMTVDGVPLGSAAGTRQFCSWTNHTYQFEADGGVVPIPVSIVTASPLFWLIAMTPLFCLTALALISLPGVFTPPSEGETDGATPPLRSGGEVKFSEIALVALGFFIIVMLLWLPFGFGGNATVDNWEYRAWFASDVFPLFNAPVSPHRPFTYMNDALAYFLTPDSWVGLNGMLIAYLVIKAVLVYTLLRRLLPRQRGLALAVALILTLHPVDPFYIGGIGVQATLIFWLIAAHLLLSYWRKPSVLLFGAAQVFALLTLSIYEVLLPLLFVLPLLLLLDTPRLSRRWFAVALLWSIMPAVWGAYFVIWYVTSPSPYFSRANQVATGGVSRISALIEVYQRALFKHYLDAGRLLWRDLRGLNRELIFGAVAALVTVVIGWRALKTPARLSFRQAAVVIGAGLVIIFLGVVVYMPSALFQTYALALTHPYFAANLGAALVLGAVIALLPRRGLQIGALAVIAAVLVPYLIAQHRLAQQNAGYTAAVLQPIIHAAPAVQPGADILLIDEEQRLTLHLFQYVLDAGLRAIYDEGDLRARHCSNVVTVPDAERVDTQTQAWCEFTPEGVNVKGYDEFRDVPVYAFYRGEREVFPYENLVVLEVTADGLRLVESLPPEWGITTDAYRPLDHVDASAPLPPRYHSMIEPCNCLETGEDNR